MVRLVSKDGEDVNILSVHHSIALHDTHGLAAKLVVDPADVVTQSIRT